MYLTPWTGKGREAEARKAALELRRIDCQVEHRLPSTSLHPLGGVPGAARASSPSPMPSPIHRLRRLAAVALLTTPASLAFQTQVFVDAVGGDDQNLGTSPADAFRTFTAATGSIPNTPIDRKNPNRSSSRRCIGPAIGRSG